MFSAAHPSPAECTELFHGCVFIAQPPCALEATQLVAIPGTGLVRGAARARARVAEAPSCVRLQLASGVELRGAATHAVYVLDATNEQNQCRWATLG